jgi:hypothetical protein
MRSEDERTGRDLLGAGCLALFGLPFALLGLLLAAAALSQLGQGAWKDALVGSFYALLMGGTGFGLIYLSFWNPSRIHVTPALEASAPGEPWRWRQDWAAGRIISADRQGHRLAWGYAAAWNLFFSYLYVRLPGELRRENWGALVGLIFLIFGIGLIISAVRATLRWRKFGVSTFEMAQTPAAIGGRLAGRITSERLPAGASSIELRLACVRRERHGRSTTERVIWKAEKTLTDQPIHFSGGIPVEFDIPAECEPASATRSSLPYIKWRLQAIAEVPGVDYAPKFDVPVFRTTSAPAVASAEAPAPGRR